MKLTKSRLTQIIKEELANAENIEEGHGPGEEYLDKWLVQRVGELFRRITALEKQVGVQWKGEGE